MEAATREATLSAIHESMVKLSMTLGRIALRQEDMLVDLEKMTAALVRTTTASPMFALSRVLEQTEVNPLLPSAFSAPHVVGAGAPHKEAIPALSMPTRCSMLGLDANNGSDQAVIAFPSRGNTEGAVLASLALVPSLDKPLQRHASLEFNMLPPTTSLMQCCRDSTGAQDFSFKQETSSSSSPTPSPLVGPGFSPRPPVTVFPVSVDISSLVPSCMIDGVAGEVFTDIGGLSLFLEIELDSADEVFNDSPLKDMVVWDKDLAGCVVTHIGGLSLFLEHDMGVKLEPEGKVHTHLNRAGCEVGLVFLVEVKMLQPLPRERKQHATNSPTLLLPWDRGKQELVTQGLCWHVTHAEKGIMPTLPWDPVACCLLPIVARSLQYMLVLNRTVTDIHALRSVNHHDKMLPWVRGGFSPGDCATEDNHFEFVKLPIWTQSNFCPGKYGMRSKVCTFKEVPPWRRNAFSPGHSVIQGNHLLLESIQPWRNVVFSPRKSTLMKPNEQKWDRGDLQVEKMQTAVILPWFCFVTQSDVQKYSHKLITCSQRPPMSATPIQAMEISDKYYRQVQSDDTAQPKCCMLHKIRELNVSIITGFSWAPQSGRIARNLWYMLALIGNIYVVLDCINLWPTEMKMALYRIEANNLAGNTYVLEDSLETLVVITLSHTYSSLAEFPVMVNSAQYFCNIRTGDLDRELQYSPCNLDVQNHMIRQVQQELWKCYYFCFLILLANHLQYKQWDPGVMCNLSADEIQIFSARPRRIADQISWLRRRFLYISWSCSLLQHEQAIAWGQAMFFGGGIVMSGALGDVGLGLMGW